MRKQPSPSNHLQYKPTTKVDRVQNEAVKFISGGMKSSPIAACEIDSNIEPLNLRREATVVEMVERYRRNDKDDPNRKDIEQWSLRDNIKQKSIMKVEKQLQEKHHLPNNRVTESPISADLLLPNRSLQAPIISLVLTEEVSEKDANPMDLQNLGVKTI